MTKLNLRNRRNPIWIILLILLILIFMIRFAGVRTYAAETDGFLPGGAWVLDTGKEIQADTLFYNNAGDSDNEIINAEGCSMDEMEYEASYDPRDYGLVTEVKDQGRTALCWDFAANSTAESVLIKTGGYESIDLSEYQTAAYAYMSLKDSGELPDTMTFYEFCNDGGKPSYVWNQWIKGYGPAEEEMYPAISTVSENCVMAENMEPDHVRTLASVKAVEADREAVKAEIEGKGAVFALYYSYPLYYNDFVNDRGDSSYYMPYSVDSKNHAISIVGWDDDFPAEAFAKDFVRENKDGEVADEPLPNGAWLIKNSWGKRAYKTPDEASGYYWISYYDKSLSCFTSIQFMDEEDEDFDDDPDEEEPEDDEPDGPEETVTPFIPASTEPEEPDQAETRDQPYREVSVEDVDELDDDTESCEEGDYYHGKNGRYPAGLRIQIVIKDAKVKKYKTKTVKIKGITYTIKGKKATVKKVETKRKKIKIPACIKYKGRKYPVTKIGKNAFRDNRYVRHIIIGRNIQSIGKETFEGCRRLKKITLNLLFSGR
jgi:C1A family cysteine protease